MRRSRCTPVGVDESLGHGARLRSRGRDRRVAGSARSMTGTVSPAPTPAPSGRTARPPARAIDPSWCDPWPPDDRRAAPRCRRARPSATKCVLPSGRRGSGSAAPPPPGQVQPVVGVAGQPPQPGPGEQGEADHRRHGVARQAEHRHRPSRRPGTRPNASGLAGRMATCIQRMSPIRSSTTLTRSMSPIDTPPLDSTASQLVAPRSMASMWRPRRRARAPGRRAGRPPGPPAPAASAGCCRGSGRAAATAGPSRARRRSRSRPPRPGVGEHLADAKRCHHPHPGGRHLVAGAEHPLARLHVLARRA